MAQLYYRMCCVDKQLISLLAVSFGERKLAVWCGFIYTELTVYMFCSKNIFEKSGMFHMFLDFLIQNPLLTLPVIQIYSLPLYRLGFKHGSTTWEPLSKFLKLWDPQTSCLYKARIIHTHKAFVRLHIISSLKYISFSIK